MSSFLYGLGRLAYRRRLRVLMAWLGALALLAGVAAGIAKSFDEEFSLPGTESQVALDSLSRTFPQVSGTSAQVIVVAPPGQSVRDAAVRDAIEGSIEPYEAIPQVDSATSPFDEVVKGSIAEDDQAALISVQLDVDVAEIDPATFEQLQAETRALQDAIPGSTTSIGGEAFGNSTPGFSITEALGLVVALVVLLFTLGSLRAAGMPLITAVIGVAITMVLIYGATGLTTVSSTTPLLALMLGLAVGIDYALFILSRHRDQLRGGMEPEESAARSVATAGSAVVFAGLTVMIALCGLAVAGIPFLTTMGVAAAIGVFVAVLIALTLLPAMLGFAGEKLRPKERPVRAARVRRAAKEGGAKKGLALRWVQLVTKWPVVTVLIVVAVLGGLTYPAKDLRISLPSNGTADPGTPARTTYDLVSDHFGQGFNGPLIVSATIIGSDDPVGVINGIADEIRDLPGVASVPLATPNQNADTGIVQVIPTSSPDSEETKDLVRELRSLKGHFQEKYDVPVAVTGYTAVAIDVSDRLGQALVPFGLLVVGLSLILLAMVFRSVAVPLKATLGYLLSVGASFGATAIVFEYGWFSGIFNVAQPGPVISFLPILLMGVLFGLAMDYEVFLVSRIREDYVHGSRGLGEQGGDPAQGSAVARAAIETGFVASSRVVVAAAIIMFSVFAAFVPEGEGPIKTISFGLAVGVFVDAFIVRMTLVPAVLALLGRSAWWLPRWIDRRLPSFDVEGDGLAHQVALASWPTPDDRHLIYAEGLSLAVADGARVDDVAVRVLPHQILVVDGPVGSGKTSLLLTLAGRMRLLDGRGPGQAKCKVAGLVLPEQGAAVRRSTGFVDCAAVGREQRRGGRTLREELRAVLAARPKVIFVDHVHQLTAPEDRAALASLLDEVALSEADQAVVLACHDRESVADLIGVRYSYLHLGPVPDLAETRSS
ncbi:MAG TPA: MMPL family transporter [Propionibacteriaceae bacterium]